MRRSLGQGALAIACLFVTATARTQAPPQRLLDRDNDVPLDRVLATVNDAVILESEVLTLAAGDLRALAQQLGRPLTPQERGYRLSWHLERRIDDHALAQAAKTLGIFPPERVEAILQDRLRDAEREQIRELGTWQRVTEERALQNPGASWQAIEREQRVSISADLTREMAVGLRLQNQSNLFITVRMMRDYYRRHRSRFVHGARAQIGTVVFSGSDARANAEAAAKVWQAEPLQPDELAARFQDRSALPLELVWIDDGSRQNRRADQVAFALAGPLLQVSEPVGSDGEYRLWKILDFTPARDEPFHSPAVQREIRLAMEREVHDRLLQQTIARARQRTEVWLGR